MTIDLKTHEGQALKSLLVELRELVAVAKLALTDAAVIADVNAEKKAGRPVPSWRKLNYIQAQQRQLERLQYQGRTRKQAIRRALREIKQAEE